VFRVCHLHADQDVDGLYEREPKLYPDARFIPEISISEQRKSDLPTLPFDRVLLDLLAGARLVTQFQLINGLKPELLKPALAGEHVGTLIRKDAPSAPSFMESEAAGSSGLT
jgi:molybdenum storage protein